MKPRLSIFLIIISLLVGLSANLSRACGAMESDHGSRFHHEHAHDSSTHQHEIAHFHHHCEPANGCESEQTDRPCSEDENGHCHCPGCGAVSHVTVLFSITPPILASIIWDASLQRETFYFAEHLPEAVYLPIWQPPKWLA